MTERDYILHKLALIRQELDKVTIKLYPESEEYKKLISVNVEIFCVMKTIREEY